VENLVERNPYDDSERIGEVGIARQMRLELVNEEIRPDNV